MQVKVNVASDWCGGLLFHNVLAPPAIPAPTPMFSVETPLPHKWPVGSPQHKLASSVVHKGEAIAQDGHDLGWMVPDVTPPCMPNLFYAINWPFSSRKFVFGSSKVHAGGAQVGCAQVAGWPVLPMLTCGDPVSAPTVFPVTNGGNSVIVGITMDDIFAGFGAIAFSMAVDFVFHAVDKFPGASKSLKDWGGNMAKDFGKQAFSKAMASKAAKEAAEEMAKKGTINPLKQVAKEAVNKMCPLSGKGWAKKGVSELSGLVTSAAQDNPTYKIGVGHPAAGGEVGYNFKNEEFGAKGQAIDPTGTGGTKGETGGAKNDWKGEKL